MKPRIIGTGLSGLVGSRLVELLADRFEFEDLSLETGVDLTDPKVLPQRFVATQARVCLHLAAVTNVDGCEQEKRRARESLAWKVNVEVTRNLARLAKEKGIYLVYFSTEFVFDGTKPVGELYWEDDRPNPINWYGETKYQAELAVQESGAEFLIVRLASPYRTFFPGKNDFVRAIRSRLEKGQLVKAVHDGRFNPTLVTDLAKALVVIFKKRPIGILHLVGSEPLSPLEAAKIIAEAYQLSQDLIEPVANETYFAGRARRGLNLALANQKAAQMGIKMRSFPEGISFLKETEKE